MHRRLLLRGCIFCIRAIERGEASGGFELGEASGGFELGEKSSLAWNFNM